MTRGLLFWILMLLWLLLSLYWNWGGGYVVLATPLLIFLLLALLGWQVFGPPIKG